MATHLKLPPSSFASASCGTAALIGAILATAGRATDQRRFALLPAFTFVATAVAVEHCGYIPYVTDIELDTWMLNPKALIGHSRLDRTGLVVPVAAFGRPVVQREWLEYRVRTGIEVVIDGAASFEGLARAPDQFLGKIPVALSFHATKTFAVGEGGGVASNDQKLVDRIRGVLNFGFHGIRDSSSPSINGKLSEYHAAVGLAELDGWPTKQAALHSTAELYRRLLGNAGLAERFFGAPETASCYALFRCNGKEEAIHVADSLRQHGVDFRLWYGEGLHRQTYFAHIERDSLDATEQLAPCLLGLPVAPDLSEAAVAQVVGAVAAGVFTTTKTQDPTA